MIAASDLSHLPLVTERLTVSVALSIDSVTDTDTDRVTDCVSPNDNAILTPIIVGGTHTSDTGSEYLSHSQYMQ